MACQFAGRFLAAVDSTMFPNPDEAQAAFYRYIDEHQLGENVSHADGLFGEAKANIFRQAHVFLLPSNYIYEMQPVSVLEAMAYGTVVIGTNHGLIPVMVEDGHTGFLVSYENPSEIADRIEYLMDNPHDFERMSQNSIDVFHEKFEAEVYCSRVARILQKTVF